MEAQPKKIFPKRVLLRSLDKPQEGFYVSGEIAFQSPVIEYYMNPDFEGGKEEQVTFKLITHPLLHHIVSCMMVFHEFKDKQGKQLLDAVEDEFDAPTLPQLELFEAFSFLEFKPAVQLFARMVTENPELIARVETLIDHKKIDEMGCIEFARFYMLRSGRCTSCVPVAEYGFSVQDYFDYKPEIILNRWRCAADKSSEKNELDLSGMMLTDLDGLQFLEKPEGDISNLNNKILSDLNLLSLSKNKLETLPLHILKNASKVWYLDVQGNPLCEFPCDLLHAMPRLRMIQFGSNQISAENKQQLNEILNTRKGRLFEKA
jgi:hypothetical protein